MSYLYAVEMRIPDYPFYPIKIGFSVRPSQRVREYTHGPFPCSLLGVWDAPNGVADEMNAHTRLASFRLCGEWFFPSPPVLGFIQESLKSNYLVGEILSPARVKKFQKRFEVIKQPIMDRESRGLPAQIPDPFSFKETVEDRQHDYVAKLKVRWPHPVQNLPSMLTSNDLSMLTGLKPEFIMANVYPRFQHGKIIRFSLEWFEEYLRDNPSVLGQLAA